jgi:hypothetical protein
VKAIDIKSGCQYVGLRLSVWNGLIWLIRAFTGGCVRLLQRNQQRCDVTWSCFTGRCPNWAARTRTDRPLTASSLECNISNPSHTTTTFVSVSSSTWVFTWRLTSFSAQMCEDSSVFEVRHDGYKFEM